MVIKNTKLGLGKTTTMVSVLALMVGMASAPAFAKEDIDLPVLAEEGKGPFRPHMEVEAEVELQSDTTFKSDDPDNELTDTYPTISLGVGWLFTPNFSVLGSFTLEPVLDPGPGEDRFFEDVGGYVEEIFAQYETGPMRLFAGKYNPTFGQAWDKAPGLYGADFAEDYQLTERIGLGGAATFGSHTLTANAFFVDTTGLSESFGTQRGRTNLTDGGVGNTEELDNYSITLDGENIFDIKGLGYHIGYRHQSKEAKDNGNPSDENGFAASLFGEHEVNGLTIGWIGEYAMIDGYEGTNDEATWLTVGGSLGFDRYNVTASYTMRDRDVSGSPDIDDTLFAVSVGMELVDGWAGDIGYKYAEEDSVESQTVGIHLAKTFEFSTE